MSVERKLCEERKKEQRAARPGGVLLLLLYLGFGANSDRRRV
jgi:hypothetical protein